MIFVQKIKTFFYSGMLLQGMELDGKNISKVLAENDVSLDVSKLAPLKIQTPELSTPFEQFLWESRCLPLLQMRILNKLFWSEEFRCIGEVSEESHEDDAGEDRPVSTPLGIGVFEPVCSGENTFYILLERLGLLQIKIPEHPSLDASNILLNGNAPKAKSGCLVSAESDIFVSESFTFSRDTILIKKEFVEKAKDIMDEHLFFFKKFLKEHSKNITLSHEEYIPLLLSWFPGRITIRQLS